MFGFKSGANGFACLDELIEQVESERPECDIGFLGEIDVSTLRIEHTHARDELILDASSPLARLGFGSNLVLYGNNRGQRRCSRQDVAQDVLLTTRSACALKNADISRLARPVVAIDYGQARSELEGLVLGQSIHAAVVKDRDQRYWDGARRPVWNVFLGKRRGFLLFSQPVPTFADVGKSADIVIRKIAVQDEASQRIALPGGAVC